MHYGIISTIHIQATPGAADFLAQALALIVRRFQDVDCDALYFLNPSAKSRDDWIVHCHWLSESHLTNDINSPHVALMELLTSGRVRKMWFNTFTNSELIQTSRQIGTSYE